MKTLINGLFTTTYAVTLQVGGSLHGEHQEVVRVWNPIWKGILASEHRNCARIKALRRTIKRFPGQPVSVKWE
ncbi:MAG: hypothetical protein KGL39_45775 [Patescibacteria group bacterium]|nr:hypothetical protein [Patescibacteria group bacterium]